MINPKISVIVPVYNPGKYIHACIDSLIEQTYSNLEIILIDDGSTDGSGRVCDDYAAKDNRIICVHQPNGGVSKARNAGLAIATGDYYHFPDSDDYIEKDTYEYTVSLINEHQCDAVNFEYYSDFPDGRSEIHELSDDHYGLFDRESAHRIIGSGEPFACNKLFSKKLITDSTSLGIKTLTFREDILRGEDSLFAHMAIEKAEVVWFDKRPLYHYVQSEQSACRGRFRTSQLTFMKLYGAYRPLYLPQYPDLWYRFLAGMQHLCITVYYDMWADGRDFGKEMKTVLDVFREHMKEVRNNCNLSAKVKIKFDLFFSCPKLFCIVHKVVHRF